MTVSRRSVIRKLGSLFCLGVPFLVSGPARAAPARELGPLTPFYRSTQLQGHLMGMGLMDIPDYLSSPDVDLRYRN
jgi:hypothetical protein